MKVKATAFALLFTLLSALLISCSGKNTSSSEPASGKLKGSTLFIYMCGSNLESKQGLASKNIDELLAAEVDDDFNIVIQTGGAKTWQRHDISSSEAQRYIIKDGKLKLVETLDNMNMGSASTLTDFLSWGQENYSAEKNMLVMWDHGGGSAKGVCFDENYAFDALSLTELKKAFKDAELTKKFDIIGFDACLMASVETAVTVRDYADYMIASEEIVPGGGWDYKELAKAFTVNGNIIEAGKAVCDAFIKKCTDKSKAAKYSTLSMIDLSKLDLILAKWDTLSESLSEFVGSENAFSKATSAAKRCEKFGYDTVFSGSSNMIDFLSFSKWIVRNDFKQYSEVYDIVDSVVIYSVNGGEHDNGGISFFYPITYDEDEVSEYVSLGFSDSYNKFLTTYYLNVPEQPIAFSNKGSVSEDGAFEVALTDESKKYLSTITYLLIEKDETGKNHILFSDADIKSDWTHLTFRSDFKGKRRIFYGHDFYYEPFCVENGITEYSVPAIISGNETIMRYYRNTDKNGEIFYLVPRSTDGVMEEWTPSIFYDPWEGETVQVCKDILQENGQKILNYGDTFEMKELIFEELYTEITETPLNGSEYYYVFAATDIFGNIIYSDMAAFEITESNDDEPSVRLVSVEPCTIEDEYIN